MPDVFNRTTAYGGSMSADATRMTFAQGLDAAGLIIQNIDITYSQQISRLFALESGKVYFVAGQTQGGFGATHVVGPAGIQGDFYHAYGDVCNIQGQFVISANAGCGARQETTSKVTLKFPVISSINLRATANDMIIYSGFQSTFTELTM